MNDATQASSWAADVTELHGKLTFLIGKLGAFKNLKTVDSHFRTAMADAQEVSQDYAKAIESVKGIRGQDQ